MDFAGHPLTRRQLVGASAAGTVAIALSGPGFATALEPAGLSARHRSIGAAVAESLREFDSCAAIGAPAEVVERLSALYARADAATRADIEIRLDAIERPWEEGKFVRLSPAGRAAALDRLLQDHASQGPAGLPRFHLVGAALDVIAGPWLRSRERREVTVGALVRPGCGA